MIGPGELLSRFFYHDEEPNTNSAEMRTKIYSTDFTMKTVNPTLIQTLRQADKMSLVVQFSGVSVF